MRKLSCHLPIMALAFIVAGGQAQAADPTDGARAFQPCAACHLATGKGVPGLAPSLRDRLAKVPSTQKGRDYLVMAVQKGLFGSLRADGLTFNGVMPAQGAVLGDAGTATVLNHVLVTFNGADKIAGWRPFTADEVAAVKKRYPAATAATVLGMRRLVPSPGGAP